MPLILKCVRGQNMTSESVLCRESYLITS